VRSCARRTDATLGYRYVHKVPNNRNPTESNTLVEEKPEEGIFFDLILSEQNGRRRKKDVH